MKHEDIISKLTLEQKARLMSGKNTWETVDIEELGIQSIKVSDGPHGMRTQAGAGDHLGLNASLPATCFPTAATVANSWDKDLGFRIGETLAAEAMSMGVSVILGPGLNIKRNPLCGRNFEYFSEDPYLSGKMAATYIKGIQSRGISACPKHFAVNSQETRRMAMNSVVDERTLREIYLTGFEIAVKEGKADSIMTSYNEVNGEYANENGHLLQDILYGEWGFEGCAISDWGGSNDHALGVERGSHLEMPSTGNSGMTDIIRAVKNKELDEAVLDQRVDELLDYVLRLSEVRREYEESNHDQSKVLGFDVEKHHEIAREAAEQSIVLLKNEGNLLPLQGSEKIGIFGDFAKESRYQGAGSSLVNTSKPAENFYDVLQQENHEFDVIGYAKGYKRNAKVNEKLLGEAVELAKKCDVCLVFAGLDEVSESEGLDRSHMRMPEAQNRLIEELSKVNSKLIVILSAGSPVEMPWVDGVAGLVHGYLSGQAGASAIYKVITGKVNPSGKLAETYPLKYEDVPSSNYWPSKERSSEHREGPYVGYRYFDTTKQPVLFPFGYGLSYTDFEYSNIDVSEEGVSFDLTNIGNRGGAEIAQLYIGKASDTVYRPEKELKGFEKVYLEPGETKRVKILFDDKSFRYYDMNRDKWEVESGNYTIYVASSVSDIRLTGSLYKEGTVVDGPYDKEALTAYFTGRVEQVSDETFQALYRDEVPVGRWSDEIQYNDAVCQLNRGKGILGFLFYGVLRLLLHIADVRGKPNLNLLFQYNMPIRGYSKMTGGFVTTDMAKDLTEMANGHRIKGTGKLIKDMIWRKV